jgi:hypothetical protein
LANPDQHLTPEEDVIGDPDDDGEDEVDPTLPADLWFRSMHGRQATGGLPPLTPADDARQQ